MNSEIERYDFINKQYNEWHKSHTGDDDISAPWHLFVKENLSEDNLNSKVILEIGSGRGGFSNYLAHTSPSPQKIVAADYSQAALEISRLKFTSPLIEWKQENIMDIDYPDDFFDTIISCETIEHVADPRKAIAELYRVLKSGGTLFLTCPNYFNLFGIWCIYRWLIGKPFTEGGQPYVNYIVMPLVYFWIKVMGFKVKKFVSTEFVIPGRFPKHYFNTGLPKFLRPLGFRTFYILKK